jgi:hypothetical protein
VPEVEDAVDGPELKDTCPFEVGSMPTVWRATVNTGCAPSSSRFDALGAVEGGRRAKGWRERGESGDGR